ncbi:hypothetical protein RYX36_020396 [Vicia faba]
MERNLSGVAIHYHMNNLKPEAQVLLLFILHSVRPRSHASTFTMDTAKLLHLMMTGRRIDVARIISNEMRNVAESGKEFGPGIKSSCPLVFPGLIMGLLIASRVRLPNITIFKIKTKVGDKYVDRYCLEKKIKKKETGETSFTTLNFRYLDPYLRQSNEGKQFVTPDEFVAHIAWPREGPFYQEEGAGPEEEAEAGTSGGSKTTSEAGDGMESNFMGGEE